MSRPYRSGLLSLVLALCASCDVPLTPTASSTGTVRLAVSTPAATPSDILRVIVTVSGPDMATRSTDLVLAEGLWGGVMGDLPVGPRRTFFAQAFTSPTTVSHEGRVDDVTIGTGAPGRVSLTLHERRAPYTNEAPLIDALVTSATRVKGGDSVSLSVRAHDPDPGDTLSYAWSAPLGTFSTPGQANTTWTAPAYQGQVNLTVRVSDSRGVALSVSQPLDVRVGGTADAVCATSHAPGLAVGTHRGPVARVVFDLEVELKAKLPGMVVKKAQKHIADVATAGLREEVLRRYG